MSEQISVHDNIILSYTVESEQKRIRLSTVYYRDPAPDEHTDVLFEDVLVYHFEGDNLRTIIYDIEETTAELIYDGNTELFEGLKNYGWPALEYKSREDFLARLQTEEYKAFSITPSYGLSGFVLAKQMRFIPVT